jgi:type III restriction enzyme
LAKYAEEHAGHYRRMESISEAGGKLRVLDLTKADVLLAINESKSAKSLYESTLARDYV